jgi:hypothetical protein
MALERSYKVEKTFTGWTGIGLIALAYTILYALNYAWPLSFSNYTTRIWLWSQMALTMTALVVVFRKRNSLTTGKLNLAIILGLVSGLAHWFHDPGLGLSLLEGISVLLCFLAGSVLFNDIENPDIPAFQPPLSKIILSILLGVCVALPLAIINNLYFYLNAAGAIQFQNIFVSALGALSPAIHEEIIFRFFVLALCFSLIPPGASSKLRLGAALFLAVVPHSLNHLPELFLENPPVGFLMLAATSLLFGLPMALLQIKKNLEAAIAFHWFIDFIRFLFGF